MISYSKQKLNIADAFCASSSLFQDIITDGELCRRLEKQLLDLSGGVGARMVSNATVALECIFQAAKEIFGSQVVWVPAITFISTLNASLRSGYQYDLCDVDPVTGNICISSLREKLESSPKPPDILVAVFMGGWPCDMDELYSLSAEFGFKIIVDAAHALGSTYKGRSICESKNTLASILSFHAVKVVSSGEGGAFLCNNPELFDRANIIADQGIYREGSQNSEMPWFAPNIFLGSNCRMTEFQAAIILNQLRRLGRNQKHRQKIVRLYQSISIGCDFLIEPDQAEKTSAYHLCRLSFNSIDCLDGKTKIWNFFEKRGIRLNVHYMPLYYHPSVRAIWANPPLSGAEKYWLNSFSLPCHLGLSRADKKSVVTALLALKNEQL